MPLQIKNRIVKFIDIVTIEDTETLFNWFLEKKQGKIDMSKCRHIHTAILQLLMIFKPKIEKLPEDNDLKKWIERGGISNE
ncbi:hypothetical protein THC_0415 [Caldimicrobium thiodismutans]|uniref:Uncharacterized protein n=1 Tax=Caldimicrobium thiodismutans TaxID=1653476 RepID=A0A0U4W0X2_9BACT|nr:hypothetical protein [Caldimicrobium thiodismutans]BAU22811.1 hypothetical protein THC_0415 [Caldimicrobium thiodismutans]